MQLRWYQTEALKSTIEYVEAGAGNPIISLPTGAGKSLVLSELAKLLPGKVLILSHVQEILEQNLKTFTGKVGLYSAGLGIKLVGDRVTIGGVQSVYKALNKFRDTSYIIIDECHMVGDSGRYAEIIKALDVPVIGLTASPYRLKEGYLANGPIFNGMSYEAPMLKLIEQGYLSPLKTYSSVDEFKVEGIRTMAGDFNLSDMSLAYNREAVTNKIVLDLLKYKDNYKHWLLFCIDINHAENVSAALNAAGITCEAVHSQSPRDQALLDFREGRVQAVANVNILTTGFDFPGLDLIAMLRPTKSPVLHVQAVGRGLRTAAGKTHCLVKDYAGNFKRLGPIENPYIAAENRGKGNGQQFMKTCPDCELLVHPAVRECECGYIFKFKHNLNTEAYTENTEKWYEVNEAAYVLHKKKGMPDSVKVVYRSGLNFFDYYILIEHGGYPGHKARWWLSKHWLGALDKPTTAKELLKLTNYIRVPDKILVESGDKFPIIKAEM